MPTLIHSSIAYLFIRVYIERMEKKISILLREISCKSGWSQPRIAIELGTSQPTVNRILGGQDDCMGRTKSAILTLHSKFFSADQMVELTPSLIPSPPGLTS
jgi:hypothetical protein